MKKSLSRFNEKELRNSALCFATSLLTHLINNLAYQIFFRVILWLKQGMWQQVWRSASVGRILQIDHFRVQKYLACKTRLSAKPFFWKCRVLFAREKKSSMASHWASLWNRGFGQLGNGLFVPQKHSHYAIRGNTDPVYIRTCITLFNFGF